MNNEAYVKVLEEAELAAAKAAYGFFRMNNMGTPVRDVWENLTFPQQWDWAMMLRAGEQAWWDRFDTRIKEITE